MRNARWIIPLLVTAAAPAWAQTQGAPDARLGPAVLFLLPIAVCCFAALELVLWVLAPVPLTAAVEAILRGRTRCMLTGLLAGAGVLVVVAVLSQYHGAGQRLAALLLGAAALGGLMGLTAMAALVGHGALELSGRRGSRTADVLVGAALVGFTCVIPIVGWVLGIYFLLVGLGGILQVLIRSR